MQISLCFVSNFWCVSFVMGRGLNRFRKQVVQAGEILFDGYSDDRTNMGFSTIATKNKPGKGNCSRISWARM